MNTAGSVSRVSAGLESLWNYDQSWSRIQEVSRPGRRSHLRLRIAAVVMLFALMGTTLAWVFERLSSDVPFMPHEGVSSSGGVSSAGQAG